VSFRTDIETITGSISSYLTDASTHLTEGVKFITRLVMRNPDMKNRLTQSSTLNNVSPQFVLTDVLSIVSVTRKDADSSGQLRLCLEIPEYKAGQYSDVNSIYYTSKLDPKYYVANNILSVIPEPTANQTATVKHITPDSSVAHGDSSISNFPTELNRGVVLYAASQILRKLLNVKNATLIALSLDDISAPSTASVSTVTVGSLGTAPTYSKPSSDTDYAAGSTGVDDWITDEDPEMAAVALEKQAQLVQKYGLDIQNELNEFTKELNIYQTDLQQKIQQAEISTQKEALEIQNYQTEVESYSAQVAEAVQKYQMSVQEVTQDYNWLIQQYQIVQQEMAVFLQSYIPQQIMGEEDEVATDDR
jgi:hypothetical protein